jgi:hypothetical protein
MHTEQETIQIPVNNVEREENVVGKSNFKP